MIAVIINNLRSLLEEKVHGTIVVKVSSYDVLYIQIIVPSLPVWNYYINDITDKLHEGLTTDIICGKCLQVYKRHINTLFIK